MKSPLPEDGLSGADLTPMERLVLKQVANVHPLSGGLKGAGAIVGA